MPSIRYRTVVKVLCQDCQMKFKKDCGFCTFLRYNNVTNLISFTLFLHEKHKGWIFFNVYEYKKGINQTKKLECYVKNKNEPTSKTI